MDPSRQNVRTPIENERTRIEEELDTSQRAQILQEFEKAVQKHE